MGRRKVYYFLYLCCELTTRLFVLKECGILAHSFGPGDNGRLRLGHYSKCRLQNARPEPDLR
jgi:hypothetical protein